MGSYLGSQLQQPEMDYQIQPNTASRHGRVFSSPASLNADHQDGSPLLEEDAKAGDYLIHAQEDYFLSPGRPIIAHSRF
jgi:hypothetical protein